MQKKPRKSTKTTGSGSTGQGRGQASGAAKGHSHEAGIRQNVSVKGAVSLGKQLKVIDAGASFGPMLLQKAADMPVYVSLPCQHGMPAMILTSISYKSRCKV